MPDQDLIDLLAVVLGYASSKIRNMNGVWVGNQRIAGLAPSHPASLARTERLRVERAARDADERGPVAVNAKLLHARGLR